MWGGFFAGGGVCVVFFFAGDGVCVVFFFASGGGMLFRDNLMSFLPQKHFMLGPLIRTN